MTGDEKSKVTGLSKEGPNEGVESYLKSWNNSSLKSWRRSRLHWLELNTGVLEDMRHEGPVLYPVCQELLLKGVLTVLDSLKHGEHPFGHLLLDSSLSSLLLHKRLKDSGQSRINSW
jgi:hypothetical protein